MEVYVYTHALLLSCTMAGRRVGWGVSVVAAGGGLPGGWIGGWVVRLVGDCAGRVGKGWWGEDGV